jgi:hypothetical protein
MLRCFGALGIVVALGLVIGSADGQQAKKTKMNNQMVKGTIKVVDPSKDLLVVNQKVKNEVVDRELSILDTTEFVVTAGGKTQQAVGAEGLKLLEGREGAAVQVKCDKDVNVLKVTVKAK